MPLRQHRCTQGDNLVGLWRPSFTRDRHLLYLFGGGGVVTDLLHVLDLKSGNWKSIQAMKGTPPSKRYGHTASLWKNYIVMFGGSNEFQEYCNDVVLFDVETKQWQRPELNGHQVPARYLHTATVLDDKLYVYGGFSRNTECTYVLSQMNVLDLKTFTWSKPHSVPPRYNHSATLVDRKLYIYAGKDESGKTVSDLFVVDLDSLKVLPQMGLSGEVALLKSQHFTEYIGNQQMMVFGKHGENEYGMWLLDLGTLHWKTLPRDRCFTDGVWNYFTACNADELSGGGINNQWEATIKGKDTSINLDGRQKLLLFLGNVDHERPQPYDHFKDMLLVNPEIMFLWQVPEAKLQDDFLSLLQEGQDWADYEIVSSTEEGSEPVKCHRAVLWSRWQHFRHLSRSGMREISKAQLRLPESRLVIETFVFFLYTDQLPDLIDAFVLTSLLVMGNLYLLPRLSKLCCRKLATGDFLTVETCASIFQAAVEAREEGLKALILEFMFRHHGAILRCRSLMNMSEQAWEEFLDHVPEDGVLVSPSKMTNTAATKLSS